MNKSRFISGTLLNLISLDDRNAFRTFYDMAYPIIYRFTHYFLPAKNDCEEVVSEVFYIIWKQKDSLTTINDLKAWLYIICRNEAFHYIKQREYQSNICIDDIPIILKIDALTIEGEIIEKEMLDIYNKAVEELPERCKLIFLMVREERLKHKEVAKILSITEGTVEQQMNIAIRKIVSVIKKYYPTLSYRNTKK